MARLHDPAFVGRDAELAILTSALERAGTSSGAGVIVGGEAGIGKTHLLEHFANVAAHMGSRVLMGACLEFSGRGIAYAAFVEAFRSVVRTMPPVQLPALLGPHRRGLGALLSDFDEAQAPSIRPRMDEDRHGQGRLFESVLNVLEHLGRSSPSVLIVEDIQWADDDTLDLLRFVLQNLQRARIVVVLSVRTGVPRTAPRLLRFLAESERDDWVTRIELAPFTRRDVTALVASINEQAQGRGEFVDRLLERSGGNPFYLDQLLAMPPGSSDQFPLALRDVLLARVADLGPEARRVVDAIAVHGRSPDESSLHSVLNMPDENVARALREGVDRGILSVEQDGASGRYAIRHALLREVLYQQLLPSERTGLHRQFAKHLSSVRQAGGAVAAATLAFHLDRGHEPTQAVPVLVEAGREAERAYAFGQARQHFERAVELWPDGVDTTGPEPVDRVWVLHHAADAAAAAGAFAAAIDLGRRAISGLATTSAGGGVDRLRTAELHQRLRWYLWEAGDRMAARAAVADGLREVPEDPPSTIRARLLAEAAGLGLDSGDIETAKALAEESLATARAAHGDAEQALAGGILGWCQAVLGSAETGLATYGEALAIADSFRGPEGMAVGRANLAALLDRIGRPEAALEVALEGFATVEGLGFSRTYGGELLGWAAKALLELGRWPEAAARIDQGLELSGPGRASLRLEIVGARLASYQGRTESAAAHLARARAFPRGSGESAELLAADMEQHLLTGHRDDVRAAADAAMTLYHPERPIDPALAWAAAVALRCEADAVEEARARHAASDLALATTRAKTLVGLVGEATVRQPTLRTSRDPWTAAVAALCRAEAKRAAGRVDEAIWRPVVARFEALSRPYPLAYARFRLAGAILRAGGRRTDAAEAILSAHRAAVDLAAAPLLAEIELLARHARITLEPGTAADDAGPVAEDLGLTQRESEVVRLVAAGWSNQEIADALFITRKTASVHVSNILGKFGVRNRIEAAAIAHRLGLAADVESSPARVEQA